jgi:predicted nucleic acid-binding protein
MTVVSNMSPLHYLILINCEHILPLLYGQVFTPPAVIEEMRAPNTPEVVRRWVDSPPEWLQIVEPANIEDIPRLGQGKRGAGEKASIALAREIRADALFIDDKKGIQEAQKRGLKAVRMLTIVDRAAERGFIDNLPEVLDTLLNSTPYYAGKEVLKVVADMKQRDFERRQEPEQDRTIQDRDSLQQQPAPEPNPDPKHNHGLSRGT